MFASAASDKLVAGEVHWTKERARLSHKQIISYHPAGEGIGDLVLTWEDDDPPIPTPLTSSGRQFLKPPAAAPTQSQTAAVGC